MSSRRAHRQLMLWAAQGFGVGWIPFAPGTFGSVLGFGWLALLLLGGSPWVFLTGSLVAIGAAVGLCHAAEKTLGRTDPGCVVLDEVVAIPVCLWGWMAVGFLETKSLPAVGDFFSWNNWPLLLAVFAGFRFFDILKPWPVRQSQRLPGGWGVVVDDLLAAAYVNFVVLAGWAAKLF